ncbi:MAG: hypothetical protein LBK54_01910 [Propionibacteriaceae bacterium]|jgi:hypothetical protein|nr:hypothetical protein [Propionibacteriaceae bacterium]
MRRRSPAARLTTLAAAISLASVGLFIAPPDAGAEPPLPQYLSVTKFTENNLTEVSPGQTFSYEVVLSCSEHNCLDAAVTDALPAQFEGLSLVGVEVRPATVGHQLSVVTAGQPVNSFPATIGQDTTVTMAVSQALDSAGTVGLSAGQTLTLLLRLRVPDTGLSPLSPNVGHPITNTATSSASNSAPDSSSAAVTISVPQVLQSDLTKGWAPASATVGQTSTVSLAATNRSNVPVDRLVVTEPAQPGDGSGLDANNPFSVATLTGFSRCDLPAGASAVQVDAWVEQAGVWSWTSGQAGPSCALPAGVDFADVGGLRFTFSGDITGNAPAAHLSQGTGQARLGLALVQRSDSPATIVNTATAQTSRGAANSPVVSASANYTVTEPSLAVTVNKTFSPAGVPQGNYTTAFLTATNASRGQPVISLSVGEPDLAGQDFQFIEFPSDITYPAGAKEGKVVYHFASGPDEEVFFASGTTPASPSSAGVVTGFEVVFNSTDGPLGDNATVTVPVRLGTSGGSTDKPRDNTVRATVSNGVHTAEGERTVSVQVVDPNFIETMTKTISPPFTAVSPGGMVITGLGGNVRSDNNWVHPTAITITDQIQPAQGQREFWDGFDLSSIQPFQIPAHTALKIEVLTGSTWKELTTEQAKPGTDYYSLFTPELESLLLGIGTTRQAVTGVRFSFTNPAGFPTSQTITPYVAYQARQTTRSGAATGDDPGLPWVNTATVQGSITTDDGGSDFGGGGSGTGDGFIFAPGGCANPDDCIVGPPTNPRPLIVPTIALHKDWGRLLSVHAQSSERRTSSLLWDTTPGVASVTISDPVAPASTAMAESFFDAFDLISIAPVNVNYSDPTYSSGWALRYDSVSAVKLYDGSDWVTPDCASSGPWMTTAGFRGCALTPDEQASTVGLRIVVEPNDAARANTTDPFAPAVGSGVTSAYSDPAHPEALKRSFALQWQVRDRKRSDDSWVIRTATYNYRPNGVDLEAGWVLNRAGLTAVPLDGQVPPIDTTVEAPIAILDTVPLVQLAKSFSSASPGQPNGSSGQPLLIPGEPGTPQSDYPSTILTLTATNQASNGLAAKASYIRITEPAVADSGGAKLSLNQSAIDPDSAKADPFLADPLRTDPFLGVTDLAADSFFDRFTATGVAFSDSTQQDSAPTLFDPIKTTVHLLHYNAGAVSHSTTTAAALSALTPTQQAIELADVIGISVTFQDTDPATDGGSVAGGQWVRLTITAQARATFRVFHVDGQDQRLAVNGVTDQVTNTAFAQSYDPVQFSTPLLNEEKRGYNGAFSNASVYLHGGRLLARAGQTISPNSLTEPDRASPITVNMTGDARSPSSNDQSNLPATQVTFEDGPENTAFWDNVAFTGWNSITAPNEADQVSLCAYGAFTSGPADWTCSTPGPLTAAELPLTEAQYPLIQGLKVVFSKADGSLLGNWWQNPVVSFKAALRTTKLSGDPVAFTAAATTVTNTIKVYSWNRPLDVTSPVASAPATLSWQAGSRQLAIGKVANRGSTSIFPGDTPSTSDVVPFEMTVTNTGSGYLHLASLVDQLPPGLRYSVAPREPDLGKPYLITHSYSGSLTSTLSLEPVLNVGPVEATGQALTWTWPTADQADRLLPGESITITVYGWLEIGFYQEHEQAVNSLIVTTVEPLTRVDSTSGRPVSFVPATDPQTASTTAFVTPHAGVNFRLTNGVLGSLGTASLGDGVCQPSIPRPGQSTPTYFGPLCVADSAHGAVDSWILHAVNAGTTSVTRVTFFEALPAANDLMLVAEESRESTFRPHLVGGSLQATALDANGVVIPGLTTEYEVSYNAVACQGAWTALGQDPTVTPCTSANEVWETVDPNDLSVDWTNVRAIRVSLSFDQASPLGPAGTVDVQFDTVNVPNSAVGAEDGAEAETSASVDAVDAAWIQYGATYHDATRLAPLKLSPPKVGLALNTGSFSVQKLITGTGTEVAPASFEATLSCSLPYTDAFGNPRSAPLRFNGQTDGRLTLSQAADLKAEVTKVPLGSVCQIGEAGSVGAYGEISRSAEADQFTVEAGLVNQTVLTNVYVARAVPATGSDQRPPYLALLCLVAGVALVCAARRSRRTD